MTTFLQEYILCKMLWSWRGLWLLAIKIEAVGEKLRREEQKKKKIG